MESTSSNEILIETGITIEDDGVVASLETKLLQEEHHFICRKSCIFKVPARIREIDEEAFIPKAVSIGPYHHKKLEQYKAMEKCKVHYLKHFLSHRPSTTLKDCVEMLKGLEEEARGCYTDDIDLTSDEFVEMMMLDGCFIIEYLLRWWKPELRDENNNQYPLLSLAYMITMCVDDLVLLENQLPFFVLVALFNFINNISDSEKLWEASFPGLALLIFYGWDVDVSNNISEEYKPIHLLDVLYGCYVTSECTEEMRLMKSDTIPTATQLQEAGVKIRAAPKGTATLLNVKFENGILEIPQLAVNSRMKLKFQNMIAFERCYYSSSYCLNYLRLLDHLIDTPSDVLLLKDKGIIINLFGDDEEVADMFNNIGSSVISTVDSQYTDLYEELNQYYANPWRKWKAMLKRDYFNSPWSSIAFAAAAMILIWTLIQTICTVMQTVKQFET